MSEFGVVLVHTTSAALRGEKLLQREGLVVKLIPVPRELSSDCGIALRFLWSDKDDVEAALARGGLEIAGTYAI